MTTAQKARLERVKIIQSLMDDGFNQSQIARKMGISRQNVNQLLNRDKHLARVKLRYEVSVGKTIKPLLCMACGRKARLSAHHEDYREPLLVTWLCLDCHAKTIRNSDKHGTRLKYKNGCRCDECRRAFADFQAKWF